MKSTFLNLKSRFKWLSGLRLHSGNHEVGGSNPVSGIFVLFSKMKSLSGDFVTFRKVQQHTA